MNDLDALLTAPYVEIDDHVVPAHLGRRGQVAELLEPVEEALNDVAVGVGDRVEGRWAARRRAIW
jgi:hypothetical protein